MSFSRSSPESSEMDGVTEGEEQCSQEMQGESEVSPAMPGSADGDGQAAGREGSGQRWAGRWWLYFGKKKIRQQKKKKRRETWVVADVPRRQEKKKKIKKRVAEGLEVYKKSGKGDAGSRPKAKASGGQAVKSSSTSDGEVTAETRPGLFDESGAISFGSSKSNPGRYNFRKGFEILQFLSYL